MFYINVLARKKPRNKDIIITLLSIRTRNYEILFRNPVYLYVLPSSLVSSRVLSLLKLTFLLLLTFVPSTLIAGESLNDNFPNSF